jgi:hypothetical protein
MSKVTLLTSDHLPHGIVLPATHPLLSPTNAATNIILVTTPTKKTLKIFKNMHRNEDWKIDYWK